VISGWRAGATSDGRDDGAADIGVLPGTAEPWILTASPAGRFSVGYALSGVNAVRFLRFRCPETNNAGTGPALFEAT